MKKLRIWLLSLALACTAAWATVESGTYISDLNATYPAAGDSLTEGDDHLRWLKSAIKATFPNVSGAVTPTHTELNYVDGVTSAIQTQLNAKAATTALGMTLLSAQTASSSASLAFTGLSSTYDHYELHLIECYPATDAVALRLRTSTDGGSTYASTSGDYVWSRTEDGAAASTDGGTGTYIELGAGVQSETNTGGTNLIIYIYYPVGTTAHKRVSWHGVEGSTGGATVSTITGAGARASTADVDAVQISFSSGNIASCFAKLYGVRKS